MNESTRELLESIAVWMEDFALPAMEDDTEGGNALLSSIQQHLEDNPARDEAVFALSRHDGRGYWHEVSEEELADRLEVHLPMSDQFLVVRGDVERLKE